LTWTVDGVPAAAELPEHGEQVIGRDADASVAIPVPTMSRRQAVIRWHGSGFVIENVGATNPTRIGGAPINGAAPIADGTSIQAGGVDLIVHDLAAGDRLGGPVCSHCGRENEARGTECWFCGTSLVNAPTAIRSRRRVVCRLVAADASTHDLLEGGALTIRDSVVAESSDADGVTGPAIVIVAGTPAFLPGPGATVQEREGDVPAGDRPLRTGDIVLAGGRRHVVVVR
jgi:hypothetical protein